MGILVIDDDPAIRETLARGLQYAGYAVEAAGSGKEGLALVRRGRPDLVILDVMMPGLDGLDVCSTIRASDEQLPILMLTARDTPADQVEGLDRGADDYLLKPFVFEILLARVRTLLRRRQPPQAESLRYGDLVLDIGPRRARRGERAFDLTTTEYELLRLFLQTPERILTRDFLMDKVWGYDFEGNQNVLEVYVRYLRTKLEGASEKRLIHTVRGAGYVLRDGD